MGICQAAFVNSLDALSPGNPTGYTFGMKTAVSIPDDVRD
jgi:hypothetical protein